MRYLGSCEVCGKTVTGIPRSVSGQIVRLPWPTILWAIPWSDTANLKFTMAGPWGTCLMFSSGSVPIARSTVTGVRRKNRLHDPQPGRACS